MPPINPVEILDAFALFLTENGGINESVEQMQLEKIYDIMKNCSTKLVSKCIYFQILMSSTPHVLEQFLNIGGWDLICLWVKSSRDTGSVTFLVELLKLLHMVPMNIERLRQNECPKIVKKLCKHDKPEIATKANQIIKKWTKIIHSLSEKSNPSAAMPNNIGAVGKTGDGSKEKKRKSSAVDNSTLSSNSSDSTSSKKMKYSNENSVAMGGKFLIQVTNNNNGETSTEVKRFIINEKITTLPINNNEIIAIKRPVTAKVKQGKIRLDLTAPSATTPKPSDKKSVKTNIDSKKSLKIPGNNVAKINNSGNQVKSPTIKTFLKDSTSFMDALSMVPEVGNIKKRRKTNSNNRDHTNATDSKLQSQENVMAARNDNSVDHLNHIDSSAGNGNGGGCVKGGGGSSSGVFSSAVDNNKLVTNQSAINETISNENQQPQQQPFSFYKDILDEKSSKNSAGNSACDDEQESRNKAAAAAAGTITTSPESPEQANNSGIDLDDDSRSESETPDVNATTVCDYDSQDGQRKPKPILCYIKKSTRKSVRWPDDDQDLAQVKYFELDETERINVTRPSADMKRFDMKHEAQMMSEAKKGRCFTYAPWKLIPIDVEPCNVPVERGCNSHEKLIQTERMKTTLECFYLYNQIPDNPDDPETSFELSGGGLDGMEKSTLIIPLVDENAKAAGGKVLGIRQEQPPPPQPPPYFAPETNNMGGPVGGCGNPYNTTPISSDSMTPMGAAIPPPPPGLVYSSNTGSEQGGGNYLQPPPSSAYSNPTVGSNINQNYVAVSLPPPPPFQQQQNNQPSYMSAGPQNNYESYNGVPTSYQPPGTVSNPLPVTSLPPPTYANAPGVPPSGIFSDYNQTPPDSYGGLPPPPPMPPTSAITGYHSGGNNHQSSSSPPSSNVQQPFDSQTPSTLSFYNTNTNHNTTVTASSNNLAGGPSSVVETNNSYNSFNNYWPGATSAGAVGSGGGAAAGAAVSNYPPGGPPPPPPPPPQQQVGGGYNIQTGLPPAANAGGGKYRNRDRSRFHPRNGSEICRFYLRTGKCKFENRCNFSHAIESNQQKPPIRF